MDVLSIVVLILVAPIAVKFIDRAYRSFKSTELYKDLSDDE